MDMGVALPSFASPIAIELSAPTPPSTPRKLPPLYPYPLRIDIAVIQNSDTTPNDNYLSLPPFSPQLNQKLPNIIPSPPHPALEEYNPFFFPFPLL